MSFPGASYQRRGGGAAGAGNTNSGPAQRGGGGGGGPAPNYRGRGGGGGGGGDYYYNRQQGDEDSSRGGSNQQQQQQQPNYQNGNGNGGGAQYYNNNGYNNNNNNNYRGGGRGNSHGQFGSAPDAQQPNYYRGGGGGGGNGGGRGGPAPYYQRQQQQQQPYDQQQQQQDGRTFNNNNNSVRKDYDAIVRAFVENPKMTELEFPSTLTATDRHTVHKLAMHFNLDHKSYGPQTARVLTLTKKARIVDQRDTPLAPLQRKGTMTPKSSSVHASMFMMPPPAAATEATSIEQTRTKVVDMYQGAQFLNDATFHENSVEVLRLTQPLHSSMVQTLRAELEKSHRRMQRPFKAAQPGLSRAPAPPAAGGTSSAAYRELQAFRARLPTMKQQQRILEMVGANRVVIVCGDTGCGKTTQIPQMLLDAWSGAGKGTILCTQPRRISALAVANRVATERGESCGDSVGYIIRFENITSPSTRLIYCTTGILLRRLHHDPELEGVSCVIVDEVHERDVDTDFALLLLRELLLKNPKRDLKLIVMSATIQIDRLVDYFQKANAHTKPPLMTIPGTLFRVEEYFLEDALQWLKLPPSAAQALMIQEQSETKKAALANLDEGATDFQRVQRAAALTEIDKELEAVVPYDVIAKLIDMYDQQEANNKSYAILVFLPGWGPIDRVANMLRRSQGKYSVHMLHSSVSSADQARVFYPPPRGYRKVVLATNIAETSITIDDIVFVIDSGLSKGTNYDVAGNTSSLTSQLIAKANGIQRRGRAGRVRAGLCVHLLPKRTYDRLPDYLPPEMLRTSLEEICLQLKAVKPNEKCVDVLTHALDAPPREAIVYAIDYLRDLGALDPREEPTSLGRALATLPIHPTLGKMLLLASCLGVLSPISIIAASLTVKSPFIKPLPHQVEELAAIRREFDQGDLSDHLVVLRLYQEWKRGGCQVDYAMRHMADQSALNAIKRTSDQLVKLVFHSGFLKKVPDADRTWYVSRHATNTGLVRLALLWSLMPRIGVVEKHPRMSKADLFCWDNKPTQVSKSSVFFKRKRWEFAHREFFVYYERMRIESQLQVLDATAVTRLAVCLCARHADDYPVSKLNVVHALEDRESKYGPFEEFLSVDKVFADHPAAPPSSTGCDGASPNGTAGDEDEADEEDKKHVADEEEEQKREAPKLLAVKDWSAVLLDHGIKCFLFPSEDAMALRSLRECMDFYFSVSMKFVDASKFPQAVVKALGLAIGYPVQEVPRPSTISTAQQDDATDSGPSSTVTGSAATAAWMSSKYSDDDADDKMLGGDGEDDEDDEDTEMELLELDAATHLTEDKLNALYGAFGDLAVVRRTLASSSAAAVAADAHAMRGDAAEVRPTVAAVVAVAQHVDPAIITAVLSTKAGGEVLAPPPPPPPPTASMQTPLVESISDDEDDDIVVLQPGAAGV